MGLDWNPLGKPKPGHEEEFTQLFCELEGRVMPKERGLWARIPSSRKLTASESKQRLERFQEIMDPPFLTLGAPRVGFDSAADDWLRQRLQQQGKEADFDTAREKMRGYYVLDLLPDCDGFPRYTHYGMYEGLDRYSFRGAFLKDAEDVLGTELFTEAWGNKLANELIEYGKTMLEKGHRYAKEKGIVDPDKLATAELDDETSPEHKVDVILSAAKWCIFWGERGHGLEVWF